MNSQFKKGVLELCVLSLLASRDYYGYELAGAVDRDLEIAEGSVYPLLKRLRDEDYVETYLEESSGGPPRKYYRLTRKGADRRKGLLAEWRAFAAAVGRITEVE
jgi:PadR family transcriptional regulator, regulatory protein PadR